MNPPLKSRCFLLELPMELQLNIYELALIESKPLLLNCPCNSSFRGRHRAQKAAEDAWSNGDTKPPLQPGLTQTCRGIRRETLPIFYGQNVFRATYCNAWSLDNLLHPQLWLKMIGPTNREMLRHLYFYDRNQNQDRWNRKHLDEISEGAAMKEMGGKMEDLSGTDCCAHLLTFGSWERKAGEVPIAREKGVPKLRIEFEV